MRIARQPRNRMPLAHTAESTHHNLHAVLQAAVLHHYIPRASETYPCNRDVATATVAHQQCAVYNLQCASAQRVLQLINK
jgi:hypothetical protein